MWSVYLWVFLFVVAVVFGEVYNKYHPRATKGTVFMTRLMFGAVGFLFLWNWL